MANELQCGNCVHFDPIGPPGTRSSIGRCAKKSVYAAQEGAGQVFPHGVKRMSDPEAPAKPFIVQRTQVIDTCGTAQKKGIGQ